MNNVNHTPYGEVVDDVLIHADVFHNLVVGNSNLLVQRERRAGALKRGFSC